MVKVITDSKTISISIKQHADCQIQNLTYPTEIEIGEAFTITYDCYNNGVTDTCYGELIDNADNSVIQSWEDTIESATSKSITINMVGRETAFSGTLNVGYIK